MILLWFSGDQILFKFRLCPTHVVVNKQTPLPDEILEKSEELGLTEEDYENTTLTETYIFPFETKNK